MNRNWLYALFAVLLVAAGIAAFTLGRSLGDRSSDPVVTGSAQRIEGLSGTAMQPVPVADVTLQNAAGETVQMGDFGKPTLVYFGFTNCPDVCPITMSRLADIQATLENPDDVQVVMVTVDPNDTPEVTHNYATAFDPSFIGLSGTGNQLAEAWKAFYIGSRKLEDGNYLHPDAVIVLDSKAQMRLIYGPPSIPALETELATILAQADF